MRRVTGHDVLFYGSPRGYEGNRARISLYQDDRMVGQIRFCDPDMTLAKDHEADGIIRIHLPSSLVRGVLDLLRSGDPVYVGLAGNQGILRTGPESMGERHEGAEASLMDPEEAEPEAEAIDDWF